MWAASRSRSRWGSASPPGSSRRSAPIAHGSLTCCARHNLLSSVSGLRAHSERLETGDRRLETYMALPLSYNIRSLYVRRKLTLLAIGGIALVIAVLVVLIAMANGFSVALRATG